MKDSLDRISLPSGLSLSRIVTGLWQMADQERDGRAFDLDAAAEALADYAREGFTTFDMADHYGSAEIVAGRAAKILAAEGGPRPTILTKWCPEPGVMDAGTVRRGVETALERLAMDRVDVMQFHWWQYQSPEYLDALVELMKLREEGLVGHIGLTNFDAAHLRMVLKQGIEVATNQVCFSVVDRRAAGELTAVAEAHGVGLLGFGTLCGGFLSNKWLGQAKPAEIADWSRMKYMRFIETAGGWDRFQTLLQALAAVGDRHGVSVSNVASRWVLEQGATAGVIVGARLGENAHRDDNRRMLGFALDAEDRATIDAAVAELDPIPGDCGDEYRKPPFLTASGDLSHHLDALPPVIAVSEPRPGRRRAESGSIWEAKAGFARAVRKGQRILVSGTTATDPHGGAVCPGDAAGQAVYILDKIAGAVSSLGGTLDDVLRTRIYLTEEADWQAVSQVHARYFGETRPANTLIVVKELIGGYAVEIEAEAELD
ncbi:aldo/keto reductase [Pseudoponticoccus marisrubri]|uniref:Aldo/keto reductase n=1 Tax=Pseudoponticoccus marisrubri TaxID=1685382 RepID=A0A0W7WK60_9RHOB|nr:aldo/keto reductase [Pseudoponticoccus marisrubri]KUF10953.1 aldo/keto reductase [Pseudoponticoccus marisrubri]